jgi:D-glycero-alpha-D-manno-heptose-7-phosphate kinase
MIISRTPYRLPLSGGGTDLDFYYKKSGGHFTSIAIDEYVYVLLMPRSIDKNYLIQTTRSEFQKNLKKIDHDLIRETLIYYKIKEKLHIGTYSTVPTRTGLGTSSAMIVGLINCINKYKNLKLSQKKIINDAYIIERKICKIHGGWQDQIVSEMGGFLNIKISKKEKLRINKIKINRKINEIVNNNFLLVYTEIKRNSSNIILSQKIRKNDISKYYDKIKSFNDPMLKAVNASSVKEVGYIFDKHWNLKKSLSNQISDKNIDKFYNNLISNYNIYGGKLIGAGGGGFFLVCTDNKIKLIKKLKRNNINYIDFSIEKYGSKIIND